MTTFVRLLTRALLLATVLAVWGGIHFYVWARLVRDTGLPGQPVAAALLVFIALLSLLALSHRAPRAIAGVVHAVAFTWMGGILPLVTFLALGDLAHVTLSNPANSLFASRLEAVIATSLAAAASVYGWVLASRPPPLTKVDVALSKWPEKLNGLKIIQISDLHVDVAMRIDEVEELVFRVNAQRPDLIALTGDMVDGTPKSLAEKVAPLGKLSARYGVWFVTGNHEYYSGGERWIETFRALGIGILHNERVRIGDDDAGFVLAGVPDWRGGDFGEAHRPRLADTLSGSDPTDEVILLAHQPRQFPQAVEMDVGLQLSGHTHGGQLWPFTILVALAEPFVAGLYRRGRSQLYVSRGTGTWGPRVRTLAPQELTELTIRRA